MLEAVMISNISVRSSPSTRITLPDPDPDPVGATVGGRGPDPEPDPVGGRGPGPEPDPVDPPIPLSTQAHLDPIPPMPPPPVSLPAPDPGCGDPDPVGVGSASALHFERKCVHPNLDNTRSGALLVTLCRAATFCTIRLQAEGASASLLSQFHLFILKIFHPIRCCQPACSWWHPCDQGHQEVWHTLAPFSFPISWPVPHHPGLNVHGSDGTHHVHILRAGVPHHGADPGEATGTVHGRALHGAVAVTFTFSTSIRTVAFA